MTQPTSSQPSPAPPKKGSAVKWVVIAVVVIVIVAGVVIAVTYHPSSKKPKQTLSLAPSVSGIVAQAGSPITFFPGTPSGYNWTKIVWNFGDGSSQSVNSTSQVTHSYSTPGSYLVSVYAVSANATASGNSSLQHITVNPPLSPNPAAIYGPIDWTSSSGNQTIAAGGWVNMTFYGFVDPIPLVVGKPVPGQVSYTIQKFTWNVDNGAQIIVGNNTNANATGVYNYPETVNLTFAQGLHTVELTTTTNNSAGATVNGSYIMTIYAGSYNISQKLPATAANKNQLVNAEFLPGNPRTLDPALSYDTQSYEVVDEIYQFLIAYNGSSTTQYHPQVAKYVPSANNGGITVQGDQSQYTNITFFINTSVQFSNGDHVNAYDVFESFARSLLFSNNSATASWILAQGLLPGLSIYGPFDTGFYWIHHAVTYDNASQTVTFHLLPSVPVYANTTSTQGMAAQYASHLSSFMQENNVTSVEVYNYGVAGIFFQFLAGPTVSMIMDNSWLAQHGGSPGNSSTTFAFFANGTTSPSIVANWNQYIKNNPMGTGPYVLSLNEQGEIILTVNQYYDQTQSGVSPSHLIPKVILEYLTNEQEAVSQLQSGYAQFAFGTNTPDQIPLMQSLTNQGTLSSEISVEMDTFFWAFNMNINVTLAKTLDSKFNAPASFFDNLSVRKAFGYAFNYSYYIDQLYTVNGIPLQQLTSGILPQGIGNYPTQITQYGPEPGNYSLSQAKHFWDQTNYSQSSTVYHITIVDASGLVVQDAMRNVWAAAIKNVTDGKVVIDMVDIPFGEEVTYTSLGGPGSNPMPIYYLGWIDDYPAAADFTAPIIGPLGIYSYPDGIDPAVFNNTTWFQSQGMNSAQIADMNAQWENISQMWNYLSQANLQPPTPAGSANVTQLNYLALKIDINMFFYVGTSQTVSPVYYSSSISSTSLEPTRNVAVGWSYIVYYPIQYNS